MADTKKVTRTITKVQAIRAGNVAQWTVSDTPSPQVVTSYVKGDVLEVEKATADSLVRAKRAKFLDPKEEKSFIESEAIRLEEAAENGNFLNDMERREYFKSHDLKIQEVV